MRIIEEKGVVTEIREGKALVRVEGKGGSECGMGCRCCDALSGGRPVATVDAGDLEPGDVVRLRIPRVSPYLSMGLICGLPIALFIAGYLVGQQFSKTSGQGDLGLLGAIVGLIVAVLIAWLVNRTLASGHEPEAKRIG